MPPMLARFWLDGSGPNRRPNGATRACRSDRMTPGSTTAVRLSGSTSTMVLRCRAKSMTIPVTDRIAGNRCPAAPTGHRHAGLPADRQGGQHVIGIQRLHDNRWQHSIIAGIRRILRPPPRLVRHLATHDPAELRGDAHRDLGAGRQRRAHSVVPGMVIRPNRPCHIRAARLPPRHPNPAARPAGGVAISARSAAVIRGKHPERGGRCSPSAVTSKKFRWIRWSTTSVTSTWKPVPVATATGGSIPLPDGERGAAFLLGHRPGPPGQILGGRDLPHDDGRPPGDLEKLPHIRESRFRINDLDANGGHQLGPSALVVIEHPHLAAGPPTHVGLQRVGEMIVADQPDSGLDDTGNRGRQHVGVTAQHTIAEARPDCRCHRCPRNIRIRHVPAPAARGRRVADLVPFVAVVLRVGHVGRPSG